MAHRAHFLIWPPTLPYMTNLPLCADSSKSVIESSGKCGNFARPFLYRAAGNYVPLPRHGDWKGQY